MSSGENDDSARYSYKKNVSVNVVEGEDVIKCLTNENQSAVHWNEIPSCSKFNHDTVMAPNSFRSHKDELTDVLSDRSDRLIDSDFIVINLSCDVKNVCDSRMKESAVGTNVYNIDCDNPSILSVGASQSLVPVTNNEIVRSENQKLVSLSLSILLAALLEAMRCFAQFLEDIVTPQKL
ncbi:uncharacterized protein LOC120630052 [Pararge aegeria]|uniref:Jg16331 protein n=1 Tax=Pararge aegeria aegeria TaxID=348720 RepID=A0A8S4RTZ1_9NEOP|nr:uncharacterized protein LOC120630052 [Pararge aegeria]CAH2241767.1 jg16331 [Pararge aegeria aegeria]